MRFLKISIIYLLLLSNMTSDVTHLNDFNPDRPTVFPAGLFTLQPALDLLPPGSTARQSPTGCQPAMLVCYWLAYTRNKAPNVWQIDGHTCGSTTPFTVSQYCSRYTSNGDCEPRVLFWGCPDGHRWEMLVAWIILEFRCLDYQPYRTLHCSAGSCCLVFAQGRWVAQGLRSSDASCMQGRLSTSSLLGGFRGWTIHICRSELCLS